MEPVESTVEILLAKALNRTFDRGWVNWAVEMLEAGFETDNLLILAGEFEPFNQFEMQSLTSNVLKELNLNFSDKKQIIQNYICHLVRKSLVGEFSYLSTLYKLKELYNELNLEGSLQNFYLLYFAKFDLLDSGNQWYWEGANRENIDKIIEDEFRSWAEKCKAKA